MAITTLNTADSGATSRTTINDNFTDLDTTKADLASPTFTGTPTLPTGTTAVTQTAGDNSTKVATTAYADAATTQFDTTEVVAATTASTWTDLDLSSVIGVTQKMVTLKIRATSATASYVAMRRNGDTSEYYSNSVTNGNCVKVDSNTDMAAAYITLPTDASGVVEYYSGRNDNVISMEAYW